MYHIFLPYLGPFDCGVDIFVPYGLDLDFLVSLFTLHEWIHEYTIEYLPKFGSDYSFGGNEDVNR